MDHPVDHVISVEDVWGSRWLRCLYHVAKYNPDQLLTQFSKKDRTWGIDFYMRCFSQLPTEDTASATWARQNTDKAKSHQHSALYRVEKDCNNNKRLRIRFFKADHPYDLEFPDAFLRERFYECAKALRQFPIWLPSVCPITATRPLAIEIHGKTVVESVGGAASETQEISGIAKLRASISPTEDIKLWTGSIDLRHGLPNPATLHEYMPPGAADFYVAAFEDIPASLQRSSQLGEMLSKHLGPDYVPLLSTELEAGKRTVAMQVICNKQKALRVSNTSAWTGNLTRSRRQASKGKNPFSSLRKKTGSTIGPDSGSLTGTGTATTDMVSLSFNVNETSLCFIATKILLLEDDVGEAGIQIRNDTMKQLLTRLELGTSAGGDTCQKFDHCFILGGIGYGCEVENHNWHALSQLPRSADRLQREVSSNNCLSNFIESDLQMAQTAMLSELNLSQRILYKSLPGQIIRPLQHCYRTFRFEAQSGRHMSHGVSHQFVLSTQLIYTQALAPPPANRELQISSVEHVPPQVGAGGGGSLVLVVYSHCSSNNIRSPIINNQVPVMETLTPTTSAKIFLERQYVWFTITSDKEKDFKDIHGTGLLPLSGIIANEAVGEMTVEIPLYRGGIPTTASLKCRLSVKVDRTPIMAALQKTESREGVPRSEIIAEEEAAWNELMNLVPLSLADISQQTQRRHAEERRELEEDDEFDGRADIEDAEEEEWIAIQSAILSLSDTVRQQATDQNQLVAIEVQNREAVQNEELTERNSIIMFHNQHLQQTTQLTQNLLSEREAENNNRELIAAEEAAEYASLLASVSASQRGSVEVVEAHHRTQILKEEAAALAEIVSEINKSMASIYEVNLEKQRQSFITQVEGLLSTHVQQEEQTEWESLMFNFEKTKNAITNAARKAHELRLQRQRSQIEDAEEGPRRLIQEEENEAFSEIFHTAQAEYISSKKTEAARLAKIERHRVGLIQEAIDICEEIQKDEDVKFEVLLKYEHSDRMNVLQRLRLRFEKKLQKDLQQQELKTRTNICKSEQELWRRVITSEIQSRNEARHQLQSRQYHQRASHSDDEQKDRNFHELKETSAWTLLIQSHQIELAAADSKTQGRIQEEITGRNNVIIEETELWFGMMEIERESRKCARRSHQDRTLRALRERSDLEVLESTKRAQIERSEQTFFQTLAEDHVLPDVLTIDYSSSVNETELFQQQQRIPLDEQRPRMLLEREEQKAFDSIVADFGLGLLDSEIRTEMSQAFSQERLNRTAIAEEETSDWEDLLDAFVDGKTIAASSAIKHQVGSQSLLQETEWDEQRRRREVMISCLYEVENMLLDSEKDLRNIIAAESLVLFTDLLPTYKLDGKAAMRNWKQRELSQDTVRWEETEHRNAICGEEDRLWRELIVMEEEHAAVAVKFFNIYGNESVDSNGTRTPPPEHCLYSYHSSPSAIPLDTESESSFDSHDTSMSATPIMSTPDSLPFKQPDSYCSRLSADVLNNFEHSPVSPQGYMEAEYQQSPFPVNSKVRTPGPQSPIATVLSYDKTVGRVTVSGSDGIQVFDEKMLVRCEEPFQVGDRVEVMPPQEGSGVVLSIDTNTQLVTISFDDDVVRLVPHHLVLPTQINLCRQPTVTSPSAISYHGDLGFNRQMTATTGDDDIKVGDKVRITPYEGTATVVEINSSSQLIKVTTDDGTTVMVPQQFVATDTEMSPVVGDHVSIITSHGTGFVQAIDSTNQLMTISFDNSNEGVKLVPNHFVFPLLPFQRQLTSASAVSYHREESLDVDTGLFEEYLDSHFGKVVKYTPSGDIKIIIGCGTGGEVLVTSGSGLELVSKTDIATITSTDQTAPLHKTISYEGQDHLIVGRSTDGDLLTVNGDTVNLVPFTNNVMHTIQPTSLEKLFPINTFITITNDPSLAHWKVIGHQSDQIVVMSDSEELRLFKENEAKTFHPTHKYPIGSQVQQRSDTNTDYCLVIGHIAEEVDNLIILLNQTTSEAFCISESDPTVSFCTFPMGTAVQTHSGDNAIIVSMDQTEDEQFAWISYKDDGNNQWSEPERVLVSELLLPLGTEVVYKATNTKARVCSTDPLTIQFDDQSDQVVCFDDITIQLPNNCDTTKSNMLIEDNEGQVARVLFKIDKTIFVEKNTPQANHQITSFLDTDVLTVRSCQHLFPFGSTFFKGGIIVGYYKDHLIIRNDKGIQIVLPSVTNLPVLSVNKTVKVDNGSGLAEGKLLGPVSNGKIPIMMVGSNNVALVEEECVDLDPVCSPAWSDGLGVPVVAVSSSVPPTDTVVVSTGNSLQLVPRNTLHTPSSRSSLRSRFSLHKSTSAGIIVGYHLTKDEVAVQTHSGIEYHLAGDIQMEDRNEEGFVAEKATGSTFKVVTQDFGGRSVIACSIDSGMFVSLSQNSFLSIPAISLPRVGDIVVDGNGVSCIVLSYHPSTAEVFLASLTTGAYQLLPPGVVKPHPGYQFHPVGEKARIKSKECACTILSTDKTIGRHLVRTLAGDVQAVPCDDVVTVTDSEPDAFTVGMTVCYDGVDYFVICVGTDDYLIGEDVKNQIIKELRKSDLTPKTTSSSQQKFSVGETVQNNLGELYTIVGEQQVSHNILMRESVGADIISVSRSLISHTHNPVSNNYDIGDVVNYKDQPYSVTGFYPHHNGIIITPANGGTSVVVNKSKLSHESLDSDELPPPISVGSYAHISGFDASKSFKIVTIDSLHGMLTCVDTEGQFHCVEQHRSVRCPPPETLFSDGAVVECDESGERFTVVGRDAVIGSLICLSHSSEREVFATISEDRLILVHDKIDFTINDTVELVSDHNQKLTVVGIDDPTHRVIVLTPSSEVVLIGQSDIRKCDPQVENYMSAVVEEEQTNSIFRVISVDEATGQLVCIQINGCSNIQLLRKSDVRVVESIENSVPSLGDSVRFNGMTYVVVGNDHCTGRVVCLSTVDESCELVSYHSIETVDTNASILRGTIVQQSSTGRLGIVVGFHQSIQRHLIRFDIDEVSLVHSSSFLSTTDQLSTMFPVCCTVTAPHPETNKPTPASVTHIDPANGTIFVKFIDGHTSSLFFTQVTLSKLPTSNIKAMYPVKSMLSVTQGSGSERFIVTGHDTDGGIIAYNKESGCRLIHELEILATVTPQNATSLEERFPTGSCAADSNDGTVGVVVGHDPTLNRVVIQDRNSGVVSLLSADQSAVVSHRTQKSDNTQPYPIGSIVDNIVNGTQGIVVGHNTFFNTYPHVMVETADKQIHSFPEDQLRVIESAISLEELRARYPKHCSVVTKLIPPQPGIVVGHSHNDVVIRITEGNESGDIKILNHTLLQVTDYTSHEVGVPTSVELIPIHTTVQIQGLTTATELNGCSGKIVGYEDNRYLVQIDHQVFSSIGHSPTSALHTRVLSEQYLVVTSQQDELSRVKLDMQRSAIEAEQSRTAYITDVMEIQKESNAAKKEMLRMAAELEQYRTENKVLKTRLSEQRTTPVFTPGCTVEAVSSGLQGQVLQIESDRGCIMLEGHSSPQWISLDLLRAGRCLDKDLSKARSEIARLQSLLSGAFSREEELTQQVAEKEGEIRRVKDQQKLYSPTASDTPSDLAAALTSARRKVEWMSKGVASSPGAPSVSKMSPPPTETVNTQRKRLPSSREGFWGHSTDSPLPPSFYPDDAEKPDIDPE